MELLLPEFRDALTAFLASDTPCIGVVKGLKNAHAMTHTVGLPEDYLTAAEDLRQLLASDPHTQILELSSRDDEIVWNAVTGWVEEYAHA